MGLRWTLLLIALLGALRAAPAEAAVVGWLYDVRVPVTGQSAAERQAAAAEGLATVLLRVTGLEALPEDPNVAQALAAPDGYYAQFGYDTERDEDGETMYLELRFSPAAVRALVNAAALPVWSAHRQSVLVWIVREHDGQRESVGAATDSPLAEQIQKTARSRGLDVMLPLMDLQDRISVSESELWAGFQEEIELARERYRADAVLIGRIPDAFDGSIRSRWEFVAPDVSFDFVLETETAEAAATAAVERVVDELVSRFAVVGMDQQTLWLRVEGITNLARYASLRRYLSRLEYIEDHQIVEVLDDTLTVALVTRTSSAQLRRLLALDGYLAASGPSGFADNVLYVTWQGNGD